MKRILSIAIFAIVALAGYAQKLENSGTSNGVLKISTTEYTLKLAHDFNLSLEKYNDGVNTQYFIKGESEKNESHSFPENAKMLFKLSDGSVMELTAFFSYINYIESKNDYYPTAYYPISEGQLQQLFGGISKIRVEMLSVDKDEVIFQDLQDIDYKKDKLGAVFKTMYNVIADEEKHISDMSQKATTVKDASADF